MLASDWKSTATAINNVLATLGVVGAMTGRVQGT